MAAGTTASKAPEKPAGLTFEVEESIPKVGRGKPADPQTLQIRDELEKSRKDQKARSIKGVETKEQREEWARKVRAAGDKCSPAMKTNTIYAPEEKKMYFGPQEVIVALQKKMKGETA
jgi:hypothetical protein